MRTRARGRSAVFLARTEKKKGEVKSYDLSGCHWKVKAGGTPQPVREVRFLHVQMAQGKRDFHQGELG